MPGSLTAPPTRRLFVLGDSISIHYGPFLELFLAGRCSCSRKGSELLPAGTSPSVTLQRLAELDPGLPELNGGDSAAVLAYLKTRPPQCDLLLLNCGLHDLRKDPSHGAHQVEPEDYAHNLDEIVRLAMGIAPRVVWVRTTPVAGAHHNRLSAEFHRENEDVVAYNAIADQMMAQAGISGIDLYTFTLRLAEQPGGLEALIDDHVHFTLPVRRLQAAYIAGRLEGYLD